MAEGHTNRQIHSVISASYRNDPLARGLPYWPDMQAHLSTLMFSSICKDISAGRPLWGLVRANEHLPRTHPLYTALCARARQIIGTDDVSRLSALEIVSQGKRLSELDPDTSAKVTGESTRKAATTRDVSLLPGMRVRSTMRRALSRGRTCHTRKFFSPHASANAIAALK